jgi:hypothetical protein
MSFGAINPATNPADACVMAGTPSDPTMTYSQAPGDGLSHFLAMLTALAAKYEKNSDEYVLLNEAVRELQSFDVELHAAQHEKRLILRENARMHKQIALVRLALDVDA